MRWRGCLLMLSLLFAAPHLFGETYSASGVVLLADRDNLSLVISCQAIPGYMEAMAMPFKPKDNWVLDQAHVWAASAPSPAGPARADGLCRAGKDGDWLGCGLGAGLEA